MENVSRTITEYELLGIVELEGLGYLYGLLSLFIYSLIIFISLMVILVILSEESLHEPMYILICNLVINGMFGSTSLFPKLLFDLFSSSKTVSRAGCIIQALCVLTFGLYEIASFTIMAYDTYLSVCHPLHYVNIMTNHNVLKMIIGSFTFCFIAVFISITQTSFLPSCGTSIQNIYCDNMALIKLLCVDYSFNNLYGLIVFVTYLILTLLSIIYSYVHIFMICLNVSKDSYKKAMHTLVTHLINFSIFLVGALFIFIRYRLNNINTPVVVHILLSVGSLVLPPLLNPLIYGIRTKLLRRKIINVIKKLKCEVKWSVSS